MVLTVSLVLYAAQPAIGFGDMVAGAENLSGLYGWNRTSARPL